MTTPAHSPKQRRLAAFAAGDRSHTGRHNDWDRLTPFARYCPETGRILETGGMSLAALERLEADRGWVYLRQSADPGLHYVDLSGVRPRRRARAACPARLEGDLLSGLPIPCTVTVTDPAGDVTTIDVTPGDADATALLLGCDYPGRYRVRVASVPYTDGEFVMEAAP